MNKRNGKKNWSVLQAIKVIAIDPGVETGFCYAKISDDGRMAYYPFQSVDDVDDLWRRLDEFKPRHLIIEDFEFRGGNWAKKTGLNLFPVQAIGVARLYGLTQGQVAVHIQKAAQGKSYYTDAVLKRIDCYVRARPHAMDATRHLLQWFTFGAGFQYNGGQKLFAIRLDKWEG